MTQFMLGSALQPIAGPLADLFHKLSGPDGATKWLPAFKRFLRGENPWDGRPLFPIWRTITIGQRQSIDELIEALKDYGIEYGSWVKDALKKATLSPTRKEVDLVLVKISELGFKDGATYPMAFRKIRQLGLELCTLEMVCEARLAYLEQEDDEEFLDFAMKPVPWGETMEGMCTFDLRNNEDTGELVIGAGDYGDGLGDDVMILCVWP